MSKDRSYVTAESVICVRNPKYDDDNLDRETDEIFELGHPRIHLTTQSPTKDLDIYENASRQMIRRALDKIC